MGYWSSGLNRAFETKTFQTGEHVVFDADGGRSRGVVVSVEKYFSAMPRLDIPDYRKIVQGGVTAGLVYCVFMNDRYSVLSSGFLHRVDAQS